MRRHAGMARGRCSRPNTMERVTGPQWTLCAQLTRPNTHNAMVKRRASLLDAHRGVTNLEGGIKRPGRRRKRRKRLLAHKKKRSSASVESTPAGSPQGSGEDEEDLDEDDFLSEDSSSEQQDDSEFSKKKSQPPSPSERSRPSRRRKGHCFPSFSDDENQPPSSQMVPASQLCCLFGVKLCSVWCVSPTVCGEGPQKLHLDSSPLEWSVSDVARFIKTTDCAALAQIFSEQEIDGQALLLLTQPTVQECMDLKLGPAVKLCHHIERVKLASYRQFAS
ncbi:hypothetical protein GJAV_G00173910 [Gymnothorax javanicus]|nr:hypothetical protein GJAV_G00173910 [Gymnothorax javanicus]